MISNSGSITDKTLKKRALIAASALIVSIVFLAAIFIFSLNFTNSLHDSIVPLVEKAFVEARAENNEEVYALSLKIDEIVERNETLLMLFASHRDIHELKRCTGEMVELGVNGSPSDYIEALSGILSYIELFREYNRLLIGNIL